MSGDILAKENYKSKHIVPPQEVIGELKNYMLVDGFDIVLDYDNSQHSYFFDARNGKRYTDFFTCFASVPVGMNHPKMLEDSFVNYIGKIAINKPSNSDIYSEAQATFVKTFFEIAVPDYFKYSFFIAGGALAVENALKTAFDWKVRKNFRKGYTSERGHQIMHFRESFHGRSGYTMSLTNTDPAKVDLYPKFVWPRIDNPKINFPLNPENLDDVVKREQQSLEQMKQAFTVNKDDIAAIIIEPIQGEGGDNHFRIEFLQQIRQLADENDAMLIFDEIQTGVGATGTMWAHQQLDVKPDIMVFGKKMQVCGIVVTDRIDNEPVHVFNTSSRINSTWGGSLVDMVRATRYLELIEEENMLENVQICGNHLKKKLFELEQEFPEYVSNVRGRGLFCAFDLPQKEFRNNFINKSFDDGLLILGCGQNSIRFRPRLNIIINELDEGLEKVRNALKHVIS
jgi:L-lysine 6-transaminase